MNTIEQQRLALRRILIRRAEKIVARRLRLFVPEDSDVGVRPENLLRELRETEFIRRHQCSATVLGLASTFATFGKEQLDDDFLRPNLGGETTQPCLVRIVRRADHELFAKLARQPFLQPDRRLVVDPVAALDDA